MFTLLKTSRIPIGSLLRTLTLLKHTKQERRNKELIIK